MRVQARSRAPVIWDVLPIRSLLFAPGSEPRKLARVGTFGSDAVVLDLEDAVAESTKDDARELVRAAVDRIDSVGALAVRVNSPRSSRLDGDLAAVVQPNLDCVVLPKVEDSAYLAAVEATLARLESERGMPVGAVHLVATLETVAGIDNAAEIFSFASRSSRLAAVLFGSVDFVLDAGVDPGADEQELLYARSRIVITARAAGLKRILDGPWTRIDDIEGLSRAVQRSRRLGFTGRGVIHPSHVEPVQRGFWQLSAEEVETCRAIVTAFEEGIARGGASMRVGEQFVDYPVYHRAQERLSGHRAVMDERIANE